MSETKFVDYKKLENANGAPAGSMRVPIEVEQVGVDGKGHPIFEQAVAADVMSPNTLIFEEAREVAADASGNIGEPGVVPLTQYPASGRFFVQALSTIPGTTVTLKFYNVEVFCGVRAAYIHLGDDQVLTLDTPVSFMAPVGFLLCAGDGVQQGLISIWLDGAPADAGTVYTSIRAV
jgi:hypothetical protein